MLKAVMSESRAVTERYTSSAVLLAVNCKIDGWTQKLQLNDVAEILGKVIIKVDNC